MRKRRQERAQLETKLLVGVRKGNPLNQYPILVQAPKRVLVEVEAQHRRIAGEIIVLFAVGDDEVVELVRPQQVVGHVLDL